MADFNMYTAKVQDLGDDIATQSQNYLDKIGELTSTINGLSSVWGGPTYDTFKASYDSNLANLEELNTLLNQMSGNVQETASAGEEMITTINTMME
ncbi:MAG: hypothetical protein E7167_00665 [Firmicutes bacterium]|nr:hypothetical protein [Bacillota bacterium]